MADHAKVFSASAFERLMLCPGSAVLAQGVPRTASAYSAEGTAIHAWAALRLQGDPWPEFGTTVHADGHAFTWDAEMQACGQAYVDYVQGLDPDFLLVEKRVRFGPSIGVDDPEDGFGTADAIVGKGSELIVVDLKCGRGVEVQAYVLDDDDELAPNPQLGLYAVGALAELQGFLGDFDTVRLVIVQPRLSGPSEYTLTVEELVHWANSVGRGAVERVRRAQDAAFSGFGPGVYDHLHPTEKGCKFCPAKATCPALRDEVASVVANTTDAPATPGEFADLEAWPVGAEPQGIASWLAACLSKVDLIEDWCKAVRAEAERRLVAGEPVPGYKLVQGKKGRREWSDAAEVEKLFKNTFRLKTEEMYDLSLISPASAEKLQKAKVIGPRQWAKVTSMITQGEGKPHVAPESDPRPAITVAATPNDFDLA